MNCPMCRSSDGTTFARRPQFSVEQCRGCGFRFIDTSAPAFPRDAQYIHDEPDIGAIRPEQPHIQRRVRDVLRHRQPPGLSLDIGCGKGEVALALARSGFQCTGVDMKQRLIDHLLQHFPGVTWRRAAGIEVAQLGQRFDVITMYHVLEHVSDPAEFLAAVTQLAAPGALIVIEVPNVAGWSARLKGPHWHYYTVDHVSYFRPLDLHRLAGRLGLEVLATRGYQHFSYPQDVPWKDAIKGALGWIGFQDVVSVFLRKP
jgi:SAM-dependent methyltransferase